MQNYLPKTIFIAPLNWGLGHATRDLPLIKAFLERGDRVIVAAHDRAKMLLQSEVPHCEFVDFPEYPIRYPQSSFFVTRFMFMIFPQMITRFSPMFLRTVTLWALYQTTIL